MKILIAHNYYQNSGGEDAVVKSEYALLKSYGEDVTLYERSNTELDVFSAIEKLKFLGQLSFSKDSYSRMREVLRDIQPEVVHFHNIFYMLTPSVLKACQDEEIPVVLSLHNFRLLCSNGLFFRDGHVCEECLTEHDLSKGVKHRCFKNSFFLTMMLVRMLKKTWKDNGWEQLVDRFITATHFGRTKFIEAGFSAEKIVVKPNVLFPERSEESLDQKYILYAGRLSQEKGVEILLKSWERFDQIPLKIMGTGPLEKELKALAHEKGLKNVEFLGFVSAEEYTRYMRGASCVVIPSVCYENFPRILVEAYAYGLPVIASDLGSLRELVCEKETGLLFQPGNDQDLAQKIEWLDKNQETLKHMRQMARKEFDEKYSSAKSYSLLKNIYQECLQPKKFDEKVTV